MADISKLSRLINGVSRNVDISTNTLVVDNIKVKLGGANHLTFSGSLSAIRTITMPDANVNLGHIADLNTLSGVAGGNTNLGTFTGSTIPDNSTIKSALQALETQVEIGSGTDFADNVFRISDDGDSSKKIAFQASSISASTVRTITMPDANVDLGLIATAIQSSEKGANNGVATLDAGGKIPVAQLPNSVMEYQGSWNASTNSPSLADGVGNNGDVYRASTAGTQNLGSGSQTWAVGDFVIYNGSIWEWAGGSDAVVSVNGQQGVVSLDTDDIAEGATNKYFNGKTTTDLPEGTNLYFTDERAQDAIGSALTDSSTLDFTYDDGANTISADVLSAPKIVKSMIAGESFAANTSFLVRVAVNGETAGRIYKADKDAGISGSENHKYYVMGIAMSTSLVNAGGSINVMMLGEHILGSSDTAFNASDIGKPIFLTDDGAFSLTAPSGADVALVRVGVVLNTNRMLIQGIQLLGIDAA